MADEKTLFDIRRSLHRGTLTQLTGEAGSRTDAIISSIDSQLAKLFIDKNAQLVDGGTMAYVAGSPSTLTLSGTFKLILNSTVAGGVVIKTISGDEFDFSADGRMLYVILDNRTEDSTLSGANVVADAESLPVVDNENQEVFLIAKRVDGDSERIYLRNGQSLGDGEAAVLGSSAGASSFSDSVFEIFDNGDSSKKIKFEASGVTGTNTYTVPPATDTLAGLGTAQTFSAFQTFGSGAEVSKEVDGSALATDFFRIHNTSLVEGVQYGIAFTGVDADGTFTHRASIDVGAPDNDSDSTSGFLRFFTKALGEADEAPALRMLIDQVGNVGIGTTQADDRLHINLPTSNEGGIRIGGTGFSPDNYFYFGRDGSNDLYLRVKANNNIVMQTGATPTTALTISSSQVATFANAPVVTPFSAAGIVHNNSSGVLSSSLLVDDDVASDAAIAGTKVSPNFGSQDITTTGTLNLTPTGDGDTVEIKWKRASTTNAYGALRWTDGSDFRGLLSVHQNVAQSDSSPVKTFELGAGGTAYFRGDLTQEVFSSGSKELRWFRAGDANAYAAMRFTDNGDFRGEWAIYAVAAQDDVPPIKRLSLDVDGRLRTQGDAHIFAPSGKSNITSGLTSEYILGINATSSSFASDTGILNLFTATAPGSGYHFLDCIASSTNGSPGDRKFVLRGDGSGFADTIWDSSSGADYAEYFEWADGNPFGEDRVGSSVALIGGKLKIAEVGDVVIGVVSGTAGFVGDGASLNWHGRYLKDEFGRRLTDSNGAFIPNPDFDPNEEYVPRSERSEWDVVGLVGKLRVKSGQVIPSHWIKLRDITETIAEYLVK